MPYIKCSRFKAIEDLDYAENRTGGVLNVVKKDAFEHLASLFAADIVDGEERIRISTVEEWRRHDSQIKRVAG